MNFFGGKFYSSGFYGTVDQTAPGGPAGAGSKRRIHPRYIYEPAPDEPVAKKKTRKKRQIVIETPLVEFLSPSFDFKRAVSYIEDDDDEEVLLLSIH